MIRLLCPFLEGHHLNGSVKLKSYVYLITNERTKQRNVTNLAFYDGVPVRTINTPPTLNHEIFDGPMKYSVVVVAFLR